MSEARSPGNHECLREVKCPVVRRHATGLHYATAAVRWRRAYRAERLMLIGTAAVVAAAAGTAYATILDSGGVIHCCYTSKTRRFTELHKGVTP